ncbi:MAG: patatin-like phospholipase family protein [Parachlamydiaceae bacterium]|nr:patatin-like phospholipase family protein [Parachlamydiaceae bacterium]
MKNLFVFIMSMLIISAPILAQSEQPKKVILVLGSGGNKGLAHVGVIEELGNMGIKPDMIVGCSSGAIIGALYAQNQDIAHVKEVLIGLKYDDLIDFSLFQKLAISTSKKMEKFLEENLIAKDFESLQIPFVAVVTDLNKGEPIYCKEGALHSMVLASSALPGVFPPYEENGVMYIDGGVCDPLPVRHAKSLGDYIIIASDISASIDGFEADSLPNLVRKALEVMYQRLAYFEKEEADILFEMNFPSELDTPFKDNNQQIYEKGIEAVRSQSEQILKLINPS